MSEKDEDRIAKLLALAGSTTSASERDTALAQAMKLMQRARTTEHRARERVSATIPESLGHVEVYIAARWQGRLYTTVARGFDCRVFSDAPERSKFVIIGRSADTARVLEVAPVLVSMVDARKGEQHAHGAVDMIAWQFEEALKSATETGLALRVDDSQIRAYLARLGMYSEGPRNLAPPHESHARTAGRDAGARVDVARILRK